MYTNINENNVMDINPNNVMKRNKNKRMCSGRNGSMYETITYLIINAHGIVELVSTKQQQINHKTINNTIRSINK